MTDNPIQPEPASSDVPSDISSDVSSGVPAESPDESESFPAFVGRSAELALLHQHVTTPNPTHALTITGERHIGKTALLQHFIHISSDANINIFIPLREQPPISEATWLKQLFVEAESAARDLGFGDERLPAIPENAPADVLQSWLLKTGFPKIFRLLGTYKRVIYLLDDVDVLANAIADGTLPNDHPVLLHRLISPNVGFIVAVDTSAQENMRYLAPLVDSAAFIRLKTLDAQAIRERLTQMNDSAIPEDVVQAVYRASGGYPLIVEHFASEFAKHSTVALTMQTVKQVTPQVFRASRDLIEAMWSRLSANERLVLSAIASLLYADPLRAVSPKLIEKWLVETDFPLDLTTVNVALRALEYEEIIQHRDNAVRLTTGLMQTWILDHGELRPPTLNRAPMSLKSGDTRRTLALGAALMLVLVAIVLAVMSSAPTLNTGTDSATLEPTVTLVTD